MVTRAQIALLLQVFVVAKTSCLTRCYTQYFHQVNPTALPLACSDLKDDDVNESLPITSRRRVLQAAATASSALLATPTFAVSSDPTATDNDAETITTPLEFVPALSAYVVHFFVFGERFGAIVDTGSPFLTLPCRCNKFAYKYIWGCYKPELTEASGYSNTVEGFNSNQGTVVWRKASFSFHETEPTENLVFGVLGPDLLDGPGGVFLGLIKDTDKWIRPSFLGQTGYQSFRVDLRPDDPKLVLSKKPMILDDEDYVPLTRDLSKRYGAPVNHYHAKASGFVVNGLPLRLSDNKPTYVIFDTGVSGMVVSEELFDGRYLQARKNKEKSLWGKVQVSLTTMRGNTVQLEATKPVATPLGEVTQWRKFKGNLIVLGLAFLDGVAMTIDIDDGKLQISE